MTKCSTFLKTLVRRKTVDTATLNESRLRRCLNVFDLLGIGVGGSLGLGVYVLISYVVKHDAGPSSVLSVLLAGVAALLSGMCYAELSNRFPKAGASYVYTYAVLGEMCAFVVGWTMVFENMIGAATAAKAWSQYLDGMCNGTIHGYFESKLKLHMGEYFTEYPDVSASIVVLISLTIVISNTKFTAVVTCVLSILNGLVIICIICVGFFHVRHENWTNSPGFFAFGFSGVLKGASTLFFAFIGIEHISSTIEDVKQPNRSASTALFTCTIVCFCLYFGVTCALTLSFPWYQLADFVALPRAYADENIGGAMYVLSIGGLFGLSAATIGCLFVLPRIVFALSHDMLLCKSLSAVNTYTKTPLVATIIPGIFVVIMTLFFKQETLIQMMALGVLLSCTVVAICLICVRYQPEHIGLQQEYDDLYDEQFTQCTEFVYAPFPQGGIRNYGINDQYTTGVQNCACGSKQSKQFDACTSETQLLSKQTPSNSTYHKMESVVNDTPTGSMSSLFYLPPDIPLDPTIMSLKKTTISLIIFIFTTVTMVLVWKVHDSHALDLQWWSISLVVVCSLTLIVCTCVMFRQAQNKTRLYFKAPYVPFTPLFSIFINIFLLSSLPQAVWIRFSIWLILGLVLYFAYGVRQSKEREKDEQEVVLYEIED